MNMGATSASKSRTHVQSETLSIIERKSLPEYVSEKRIAEAKRLLRGRAQLPIGQIAAAVGFSDVNYFTKVFKKKAGQTPSAYRAAQRALAAEQKEI